MLSISKTLMTSTAVAAVMILAAAGCAPQKRYHYDSIRKEYAGAVHRMDTRPDGAPMTTAKPAVWDDAVPLSLTAAIEFSLANNPDRQMAAARIAQAEAMIAQSSAGFFPTVTVSSEYLQGDAPSAYLFKTIDQRRLAPATDFNQPGWFQNYESGGTLGWNLFNGGRDLLSRRMAETGLDISALDRESIDNSLRASVIQSFYSILAAEDFLAISRESASTVQEQLRVMKVRYAAGGALKSDILSLEVRLAEAEEDVVRGENRIKTATAALANVLGIDPDSQLQLTTTEAFDDTVPETYQAGLTHALAHRPEIHQARQRVIQSRMALDLSKSGYLPRIDFQTRWYVDAPEIQDSDIAKDNWTAGVMLNWALFSGFSTQAEERQAKARLEEMLMADRKVLQSVQFDVKTAYLRLEEAEARVAVSRKSIESAEESFKLVKQQYAGGSATITRYLEAELARSRSRLHTATAAIDHLKAKADACRAIGRWSPDMDK
ncbi:MAG: TolC family protein [Pseudomonadota bacterium]